MRTIEQLEKSINNLDANFNKLISNDSLDINYIEELAMNSIDNCKSIINNHIEELISKNNHIEELISKNINEQELIIKKNKSGKKKDSN